MVMELIKGGNLREYLVKNHSKLDLKKQLIQLHSIAQGLQAIHAQGLIHHDLHAGNILDQGGIANPTDNTTYITDLVLSHPVSETDNSKVYGLLPYVAPEVLQGQPYSQASDVYSFGIVAYELLTGVPPYAEYAHDSALGAKICVGLRPRFSIKIPPLLEDLINKC